MAAYDLVANVPISAGPSAATARMRRRVGATLSLQISMASTLSVSPKVASIVPTASGLMRVTFATPMALSATLIEPANWSIMPTGTGAAARVTRITAQPGTTTPIWCDFETTEHTDAANYDCWCNGVVGFPTSATGTPTTATASRASYVGIGEAPTIASIIAIGQNRADVVFSEAMEQNVAIATAARYLFDNGLSVLSVSAVSSTTVSLVTSDQTPNVQYGLTLSSPTGIRDAARNEISGAASGAMIGWTEPAVSREAQPLKMYDFIIEDIRNEENTNGTLILKRLLEGPQQDWNRTHAAILDLSSLSSPSAVRSDLLGYLKLHVGLTPDLDKITDRLDDATLRRLIAVAANMWKWRGNEDTLTGVLSLLLGAQSWICNWFHYRWIVEETGLGNLIYNDPWLISEEDEDLYNLRIVDRPNGSLDRQLVADLAQLLKPGNETIEITYLMFLERFLVDFDTSQWQTVGTVPSMAVENNVMTIVGTPLGAYVTRWVETAVHGSEDWQSYVVTAKVRCVTGSGLVLWGVQDDENMCFLAINSPENLIANAGAPGEVVGVAVIGGASNLIANYVTPIHLGEWNGIRIVHVKIFANTWTISTYFNNELLHTATVNGDLHGKIGFYTTGTMEVAFVEAIELVNGAISLDFSSGLDEELPFVLG